MPSSADRKRLEVPTYLYDRLVEIAVDEDRTVSSVVQEVIMAGLSAYRPRNPMLADGERYSERARQALDLARQETVPFNHNYIGTEHILLGLLKEGEGIAARVLAKLGVTYEQAHDAVGHFIGRGKGSMPAPENLPFVPRARRVLRLADEEAEALSHHYVGTEHLLLALARVEDGMAARILNTLGALRDVRTETLRIADAREGRASD